VEAAADRVDVLAGSAETHTMASVAVVGSAVGLVVNRSKLAWVWSTT
jgi:hypothetical protein